MTLEELYNHKYRVRQTAHWIPIGSKHGKLRNCQGRLPTWTHKFMQCWALTLNTNSLRPLHLQILTCRLAVYLYVVGRDGCGKCRVKNGVVNNSSVNLRTYICMNTHIWNIHVHVCTLHIIYMYVHILCNDVTTILTLACVCSDLDLGAMRALGQVLNGLVLQPRGMAGDIFEQKSKLFQRYVYNVLFTLYMYIHMTYTCFLKQTRYPIRPLLYHLY